MNDLDYDLPASIVDHCRALASRSRTPDDTFQELILAAWLNRGKDAPLLNRIVSFQSIELYRRALRCGRVLKPLGHVEPTYVPSEPAEFEYLGPDADIVALLAEGHTATEIAKLRGVHPSNVSRRISRVRAYLHDLKSGVPAHALRQPGAHVGAGPRPEVREVKFCSRAKPDADGIRCTRCGNALAKPRDGRQLHAAPLSIQQRRFLENLRDGVPTNSHCRSRSDYGGLTTTEYWAIRRGYRDALYALTPRGLAVLEQGQG